MSNCYDGYMVNNNNCFLQIPVVSASRYGPVSLSSKSINYLLGLQIALASNASLGQSTSVVKYAKNVRVYNHKKMQL